MRVQADFSGAEQVLSVIRAAGGSIVGRTRLQKTMYLLELAGFAEGFDFEYRYYGPYSEDVSHATLLARMTGALKEDERRANWGGVYSIFQVSGPAPVIDLPMQEIIDLSKSANPIALELAATAAYFAAEGYERPWEETTARKPEKASYLDLGKQLYSQLLNIKTRKPLPVFSS
jgi:hypothetical protein